MRELDVKRKRISGRKRGGFPSGFLKGIGSGAVVAGMAPAALVGSEEASSANTTDEITQTTVTLNINDVAHRVDVEPRTTLLTVLRDGFDSSGNRLDLTGAKPICDRGSCGGCTVIVEGKPVYACMMLAVDVQDRDIVTVEGLASQDSLHPIQEAFVKHDALMCGFCTPGFVVAAKAFLDQNPSPTHEEIQEGLSGNVCRCGTYPFIFDAVKTASEKLGD